MLFDLLSTDMYVSYNCKLAHLIGLKAAVYMTELININRKAIHKNKTMDGFFVVDRKYIMQRTTLTLEEQKEIDKKLLEVSLIKIGESTEHLSVDMDALTGLMLEKNKSIIDSVTQKTRKKRTTKQEAIIYQLKSNIITTNEELKNAYEDWIESVIARQGWMSKKAVVEGQAVIDEYSNRDLDVALKILKYASIGGYRDMTWAINDYEKKEKSKPFINTGAIPQQQNNNIPVKRKILIDKNEVF